MTSTSSITAVAPSTSTSFVAKQPSQSPAAAIVPAITNPATAASTNSISVPSRQIEDPLAGILVTQSVGADGEVINQFPSTAVVAYLREGLSADGSPLPQAGLQSANKLA